MSDPKDTRSEKNEKDPHPGMMGDGTEEQNLNQPGDPSARITEEDVDEAFGGDTRATPEVAKPQ